MLRSAEVTSERKHEILQGFFFFIPVFMEVEYQFFQGTNWVYYFYYAPVSVPSPIGYAIFGV